MRNNKIASYTAVINNFWNAPPREINEAIAHLGPHAGVLTPPGVTSMSFDDVKGTLETRLCEQAGILISDAINPEQSRTWVNRIELEPQLWDATSPGLTTTVGAVWFAYASRYLDAPTRVAKYSEGIIQGEKSLAAVAPTLRETMFSLTEELLGERVIQRPGWAGPGIIRFAPPVETTSDEKLIGNNGDIHFDWVGLAAAGPEWLDIPCLSFVIMHQMPERGGDLRLWNIGFNTEPSEELEVNEPANAAYTVGSLLCFNGHLLHQIVGIGGHSPRITSTWHVMRPEPSGPWLLWV